MCYRVIHIFGPKAESDVLRLEANLLCFLDSFFLFKEFLAFLRVFPFFSRDCWGSEEMENPCSFGRFPCSRKPKGKEDLGWDGSNGSGFRFLRFLWEKGFSVFPYRF